MLRNKYKQAKTKYGYLKLTIIIYNVLYILPIYGSLFTCVSHI